MKIEADLVLKLRDERSWSQEELAIASGLNIRTIQRIEKEAVISLQSKKALACVFEIDIHDLDYKEISIMKKYEYKTIEIDIKTGFVKTKIPNLAQLFNIHGQNGWRLAQIIYPEVGGFDVNLSKMSAILEREIVE